MASRRLRLIVSRVVMLAMLAESQASADEPAPAPAPATPTPTAAPPAVEEVRVQGTKPLHGSTTAPRDTIGGKEIRQVPGAFGDAFRALEALPGVTPIISGLPYFFVRGAPPGNTGFFIDNVRVPGLYHLGFGPAVMYPAIIDHVDLYKGAYPVSFGRYAGGILSADTVRPADRARADWTLRLFDAGALVESPFGKDKTDREPPRGNVLVSGRYGYPGLLLSILAPDAGLAYWDYQSRVNYRLSDRDSVSVFAFGSYDSVSTRGEDPRTGVKDPELHEVLNIQFHRVDLRWDRRLSPTGSMRTAVTFGYDRTGSEAFAARSFMFGSRVLAQERVSDNIQVRGGADMWLTTYDFRLGRGNRNGGGGGDLDTDDAPPDFESGVQKDVNFATWVDTPLKIGRRAEMTPGLRADIFTSRGLLSAAKAVPALDPRVTTRVGIGPIYHLGAVGLAHQPAALPLPIPALTFAQLKRGLQGGYHMSQGVEVPLPWELTGTATTYLHTYTGLIDLVELCNPEDPRCIRTRGHSVGLELMVKRNLGKRIGGWISYTLSRSTRDAFDVERRRYTSVLSQFDRTHVFNLIVSVDLGKGWRTGGRYTTYSGIPYSTISELSLPNARTPTFHRIDLRVEKRWFQKEGRSFALTAEMFNVLLMKEAIGTRCETPGGCVPELIGPIAIPSLGFEGTL